MDQVSGRSRSPLRGTAGGMANGFCGLERNRRGRTLRNGAAPTNDLR